MKTDYEGEPLPKKKKERTLKVPKIWGLVAGLQKASRYVEEGGCTIATPLGGKIGLYCCHAATAWENIKKYLPGVDTAHTGKPEPREMRGAWKKKEEASVGDFLSRTTVPAHIALGRVKTHLEHIKENSKTYAGDNCKYWIQLFYVKK